MNEKKQPMVKISEHLLVQEEKLEVGNTRKRLTIGVPMEIAFQEKRVALTPGAVRQLVGLGHRIVMQTDAGRAANFSDHAFSEAGAIVVPGVNEVYKSDVILKVAPPSLEEIGLMHSRQTLFSSLQLSSQSSEYFRRLGRKKVVGLAFEYLQDEAGTYSLVRSMSEIAGNTTAFIAARYLSDSEYGRGEMLGGFSGISPSEVVILGAGTVGEYAARAAMGLGAVVKVFDNSIYKLRRLQSNLGVRLYTSILQPEILSRALVTADVAIGAVHALEGQVTCMVSEEMIRKMKPGAVIIDVSIDQGGCFETSRVTSHSAPVFRKYDITHYCVPNIPSQVPRTASYALSNFFAPLIIRMGEIGGIEMMLKHDTGVRHGVYAFNGSLTKAHISQRFGLPFQDIELLMAAI